LPTQQQQTAAAATEAAAAAAAAAVAATAAAARCGLRAAADANWRPEMTCAFPGPDSYALLFVFSFVCVCLS